MRWRRVNIRRKAAPAWGRELWIVFFFPSQQVDRVGSAAPVEPGQPGGGAGRRVNRQRQGLCC